jgi:hypothetical protein
MFDLDVVGLFGQEKTCRENLLDIAQAKVGGTQRESKSIPTHDPFHIDILLRAKEHMLVPSSQFSGVDEPARTNDD